MGNRKSQPRDTHPARSAVLSSQQLLALILQGLSARHHSRLLPRVCKFWASVAAREASWAPNGFHKLFDLSIGEEKQLIALNMRAQRLTVSLARDRRDKAPAILWSPPMTRSLRHLRLGTYGGQRDEMLALLVEQAPAERLAALMQHLRVLTVQEQDMLSPKVQFVKGSHEDPVLTVQTPRFLAYQRALSHNRQFYPRLVDLMSVKSATPLVTDIRVVKDVGHCCLEWFFSRRDLLGAEWIGPDSSFRRMRLVWELTGSSLLDAFQQLQRARFPPLEPGSRERKDAVASSISGPFSRIDLVVLGSDNAVREARAIMHLLSTVQTTFPGGFSLCIHDGPEAPLTCALVYMPELWKLAKLRLPLRVYIKDIPAIGAANSGPQWMTRLFHRLPETAGVARKVLLLGQAPDGHWRGSRLSRWVYQFSIWRGHKLDPM